MNYQGTACDTVTWEPLSWRDEMPAHAPAAAPLTACCLVEFLFNNATVSASSMALLRPPIVSSASMALRPNFFESQAFSVGLPPCRPRTVPLTVLHACLFAHAVVQYRHGSSMVVAAKTLYKDGGVLRFYRGYVPALMQVGSGVPFSDASTLDVRMSLRMRVWVCIVLLCFVHGPSLTHARTLCSSRTAPAQQS